MVEETPKFCPWSMGTGYQTICKKELCMAWKPHGCAFVEGIQSIRYIGRGNY